MKEDERSPLRHFWNLFMALIYIVIASFVIFTPYLLPYNYQANLKDDDQFKIPRYIFGLAMFLYGIYRGYKFFKSIKKQQK